MSENPVYEVPPQRRNPLTIVRALNSGDPPIIEASQAMRDLYDLAKEQQEAIRCFEEDLPVGVVRQHRIKQLAAVTIDVAADPVPAADMMPEKKAS